VVDDDDRRGTTDVEAALREIARTAQGGYYLMLDVGPHLTDPVVQRLVRDICESDKATLLMTGVDADLPPQLRSHAAAFTLPRPDAQTVDLRVRTLINQLTTRGRHVSHLDDAGIAQLVTALRGLTLDEIDQVFTRLVEEDGVLDVTDIPRAQAAKADSFARGGVAQLCGCEYGLEWVAGFHQLKRWAQLRGRAFAPDAQAYGLPAPRGVLLTGVPGCGKSFVVKALARDWNMPLLRMDAGALYDKFVGATEQNLRAAFSAAEALAPSVLWIDEIEKGFASTGPSESDGGLTYRLVGMLATWMQERTQPVFLAATSNDITKLPPELTRQGRFDEVFFVDLPQDAERQHLFALQLARRGRDYTKFDVAALAAASDGFSGSEIEQAVSNALYVGFGEGRELQTTDVEAELGSTRPLSRMMPEVVEQVREWGARHARPA
jgi:hypothetical protein